jgi:hypothetical protein
VNLSAWAARWAIPREAIDELCRDTLHSPESAYLDAPSSEARVQSEVRLEAARAGVYLFRNNVGAGKVESSGKFMRWGLGNDSEALNRVLKSADLIGVRKLLIEPHHVGTHLGQFVSREIKCSDWKFSGTLEEHAQLRWSTLINAQGGDAKIVTGIGSLSF